MTMESSVAIIDYGVGNLASIAKMMTKAGARTEVTGSVEEIKRASRLLLPGVGAFDACRASLNSKPGLVETILERIAQGTPTLGVCVGMQLLSNGSEEGKLPGLGLIPGEARKFDFTGVRDGEQLKTPHMGWAIIDPTATTRLCGARDGGPSRFYFVHSYHVVCEQEQHVAAWASHGYRFSAAIERDNIFCVHFHPEKSHRLGLQLFERFLEL